ncbi:MAG: ROK family protein [Prevotellaceae bacterium]|jgi:glucokinase|nr:ROK family protein [Prevotellaceae bacterium]
MKKKVVLGVDVGGTTTKLGLVDSAGSILAESSIPTPANTSGVSAADFVKQLCEAAFVLQHQPNEMFEVVGVGAGAPNANYNKGAIEFAVNLPWPHEVVPFAELIQAYFPRLPIKVTNDANAAAIGEKVYGGAKNMNDFIVITLGTGFGSGIVAGGKLVYGCDGFAGEIGHIIMIPDGRHCGCGRAGCLETYVSATGLKQTAFEVMSRRYFSGKSLLKAISFNEITPKYIADAARQGDSMALEVFERTGEMLGLALANTVAFSSPEAIFLYGGLANAGDLLLNPTRKSMNKNMLKNYCKRDDNGQILQEANTQLLLSNLCNKNGAVLGAAALVWHEQGTI